LNAPSISIHILRAGDEALLAHCAPDVFDGAISEHWVRELLASPQQSLVVALEGGVVVGMALAVQVLHPDKASKLWLNELAVAATHRRSGIARRLVTALMQEAKTRGCRQLLVSTEQTNTAARNLYQSLGARCMDDGFCVFVGDT
jgi:ribosomal protein S18 acetylase RimI-like enzyme